MKNPPAFPTNQYANGISPSGFDTGMTLRDYFAAKAMQAVYPKNWDMFMNETYEHPEEVLRGAAKNAYELADAMLKAREA